MISQTSADENFMDPSPQIGTVRVDTIIKLVTS